MAEATKLGAQAREGFLMFYLTTPRTEWLSTLGPAVSLGDQQMANLPSLPVAARPWSVRSSAYAELVRFGEVRSTAQSYLHRVARYVDEIGQLDFAIAPDWSCDRELLVSSGLSVDQHQEKTVDRYIELRSGRADLPFIAALVGQNGPDYERHLESYERRGIDLTREPFVALPSLGRRSAAVGADVISALKDYGLRLHVSGLSTAAMVNYGKVLASADSQAWIISARNDSPLAGCRHEFCTECTIYAQTWRARLLGDQNLDTGPLTFADERISRAKARRPPQSKDHPAVKSTRAKENEGPLGDRPIDCYFVASVEFSDGSRRFGFWDADAGLVSARLFASERALWQAHARGSNLWSDQPVRSSVKPVVVSVDLGDGLWWEATATSKSIGPIRWPADWQPSVDVEYPAFIGTYLPDDGDGQLTGLTYKSSS